jgi:flagellar hook assembly protein FlgD
MRYCFNGNREIPIFLFLMILLGHPPSPCSASSNRQIDQTTLQKNAAYPRTITPNGDAINDKVFFFFENPTDASISGSIYNLKGAKVSTISEETAIFSSNNSVLSWDGKDTSGSIVQGGVYLYKIMLSDKVFSGAILVVR